MINVTLKWHHINICNKIINFFNHLMSFLGHLTMIAPRNTIFLMFDYLLNFLNCYNPMLKVIRYRLVAHMKGAHGNEVVDVNM
jgi:hypothetical protein